MIAALLGSIAPPPAAPAHAARVVEPEPQLPRPPQRSVADARDVLVLDAALGEGMWRLDIKQRDVDYVEERSDGKWQASVSLVLSLSRADAASLCSANGPSVSFMHDEVGSGRADGHPDEASATCEAERAAHTSARRRLAKRFAHSLDPHLLAEPAARIPLLQAAAQASAGRLDAAVQAGTDCNPSSSSSSSTSPARTDVHDGRTCREVGWWTVSTCRHDFSYMIGPARSQPAPHVVSPPWSNQATVGTSAHGARRRRHLLTAAASVPSPRAAPITLPPLGASPGPGSRRWRMTLTVPENSISLRPSVKWRSTRPLKW